LSSRVKDATEPSQPSIIPITDYADFDSFVDQIIYENHEYYTADELWPYIESDLATYEITEETFMELAWDYYEYYEEISRYEDDDDAYAAYWNNH
jgi:hypothetical protein